MEIIRQIIAVALWAGALGGFVAIAVGVTSPSRRRVALFIAALLFLPIGVLGILTVGWMFLVLALCCTIAAALSRSRASAKSSTVPR